MGRWKKGQQKESIETEICAKTGTESESRNQHNMTSNANDVSLTVKLENENGEPF